MYSIDIQSVLAGEAHDAREDFDPPERAEVEGVIPPKFNRTDQRGYDEDQYAWRHPIKNLFAKLKQYRAIATRYDKRACVFRGGVHLAPPSSDSIDDTP